MVYINNGEHDHPHELPKENSEGSSNIDNAVYTHSDLATKLLEEIEKLEYIYQHFQECEKIHEIDPQILMEHIDGILYPQINNDIEYSQFENVVDSYYLDSQIRDVLHVPKLVMYIRILTTYLKQDHNVHTHTIIYHNT